MLNMYKGKINSPQTTLTSAINSTQTSIVVANASVLLTSPNLAVIGGETDSPETVQVTNIASNTLTVVRGFEGTAQSWGSGVKVGRNFTAYDYNTLVDNVDDLSVNKFDSIDFVDTVPTKSNVETALGFTVNKSVPANAIFTDTVYSHPLTHPYNMLTDTPTIPSVVGLASETYVNNKVRTDVPIGALFTDTTTSINSKTGVILKADVVALGIPAQDTVVDITGKVDKVTGSSLVADTEIAKIHASGSDNQDLSGLMPKSGGTFTGTTIGNDNTSYTTSQLRNARIYADGATIPTLANGEIAFIYEV